MLSKHYESRKTKTAYILKRREYIATENVVWHSSISLFFLCWCASLCSSVASDVILSFYFFLSNYHDKKKKLKIYVLKGKRYSKYVHALLYGKPLTYKDLYAIHHMYSSIVTVGQGFFSLFYFTCQALILFGLLTQHMVIQILNFDQNHCLF